MRKVINDIDNIGHKSNQHPPHSGELGEASSPLDEPTALKRLAALCAKGEHCTGEADEKMRRWGLDERARARVIARLVEGKFIDDERYTRYFVDDKIKFNHWGRLKIEQALRQKHVDESVYSPILDAVDDERYLEVLRPMIKTKMQSAGGQTDYERAMKTIRWAMGRGFQLDIIRRCIDESDEQAED